MATSADTMTRADRQDRDRWIASGLPDAVVTIMFRDGTLPPPHASRWYDSSLTTDEITEVRRSGRPAPDLAFAASLDARGLPTDSAFIVNINVLGAYVAHETMPALGRALVFRFHVPGSEREVVVDGVVAWTNPQQEHPVHSLPPGFGVAFRSLTGEARSRIEQIVVDYVARQSGD